MFKAETSVVANVTTVVSTNLTVRQVAEAFAAMDSDQQAQFFADIHDIAQGWGPFNRGMQYYYIGRDVKALGIKSPAAEALASMAAPLYAHTLTHISEWSQRVEIA